MKKIFYFILLFSCWKPAAAQLYPVHGNVFEASTHQPLQGVSVAVTGGSRTLTNSSGEFTLQSRLQRPVLVLSHTGFRTLEIKSDSSGIYFLVENIVSLKTVTVSTGYQDLSGKSATGSFEKIDNTLFNRATTPDVLSRLDGVSSSVFFSKAAGKNDIYIRGLSTINTGTAPLIVLDDFPYEGNISNLNPDDIESVTVLKDAAAAAIWGAKAGNGVIVLTSKKGGYGQKVRLTMNSTITIQQKPDVFYDKNFLNSSDFIDVEKFLFSKGRYDADLSNTSTRPVISPVVELLYDVRAGILSQSVADGRIDSLRGIDVRNDYTKYLYRNAAIQQYNGSLSGGSANVNFFLSAGYDKNLATATGNQNERATFYSLTQIKPLRKLDVQAAINYTYNKTNNDNIGKIVPGSGKNVLYPYASFADASGNALPVEYGYRSSYLDTAGGGLLLDWKYRPVDEMHLANNGDILQDILLKLGIKYQLTSSFSAEIKGEVERAQDEVRNNYSIDSYFARNFINRYSQRSGTLINRNIPNGGILDRSNNTLSAYGLRAQLNYSSRWKDHKLNFIAGSEIRNSHNASATGRTYGYNDNTLTFSNVDYISNFTLYGGLGTAAVPDVSGFTDILNRFVSFYSNAVYSFKERYTFSASARSDASNLFGVETNRKWTPLWSAGIAWQLSDEKFYNVKAVPVARLRLTYGYNGNVNNTIAAVPVIQFGFVSSATNLSYAQTSTLPNPALRWERTGIINGGLDLESRNQRITGSLEYYYKKSTDLLAPTQIDPTLGLTTLTMNSADLSGKGVDLTLNIKIIDRQIKYKVQTLFSYVTNKVLKYLPAFANKGGYAGYSYNIVPIAGYDPYSLISYRWGGLDPQTGDPMGYIGGVLSKDYTKLTSPSTFDELVIKGTTRPPYFGNIIQTVSWKAFSLSANISAKFGYYFRRPSLSYSNLFNSWLGNIEYAQRWQKPGDELITNVPSLTYPANQGRDNFYNYSEVMLEKGDIIKIQDIRASYDPTLRNKGVFKNLSLYMFISNPLVLWRANKYGIDPSYGLGIPAAPSFTFGCKASL